MDPIVEVRARSEYTALVIICIAVGIGIAVFGFIALMVARDVSAAAEPPPVVLPVFIGLSAAAIGAAVTVKRRFTEPAPRSTGARADRPASSDSPDLDTTLERIRVGVVGACALSEVPVIFGFAYLALGGDVVWAPVFFGGALVSWALAFPRPSEWNRWLSAAVS